MRSPWISVSRLDDDAFRAIRRRAIFDCCKWDPQVEDACTLAHFPLVLTTDAWAELRELAQRLARETLALERELIGRPDLHARLGLPKRSLPALAGASQDPPPGVARLIRFDFHFTPDGWRISEANTDVPGGLNEASGFPGLVAPHYAGAESVGDPSEAYVAALIGARDDGVVVAHRRVGLIHATAYSDDNQMMTYLARRLTARGVEPVLASPAAVDWRLGHAWLDGRPLDALIRFFPADWLTELPEETRWQHFYGGSRTPLSNPATALLIQSKRCPLVWPEARTPLPTWRALLPETRDPRDVRWQDGDEWVVKPALGRVGEDVGIAGITTAADWKRIAKECAKYPQHWIAQRRFETAPAELGGEQVYPCVGVYTVDEDVVGAYGRLAPRALIDGRAADAAVLTAAGA